MYEFRLRFHWSLLLRFELTIFQHWFRCWLSHLTNPTMHQKNTPQCTILWQKCAHMCVLLLQNGALQDIRLVQCDTCELGQINRALHNSVTSDCVMRLATIKVWIWIWIFGFLWNILPNWCIYVSVYHFIWFDKSWSRLSLSRSHFVKVRKEYLFAFHCSMSGHIIQQK